MLDDVAEDWNAIPRASNVLARTVSENTSVKRSLVRFKSKSVSEGEVLSMVKCWTDRALVAPIATTGLPMAAISSILAASMVRNVVAGEVASGVRRLISFISLTCRSTEMICELALLVVDKADRVKLIAATLLV